MKLLLKILGGLVLVGLVLSIIIPTVPFCGPSKETSLTQSAIGEAATGLCLYHQEYGQFPSETDNSLLVQILTGDNPRKLNFYTLDQEQSKTGQFIDGWGKPLVFKKTATESLLIRSAGKDRRYSTPDDLTHEVFMRPPAQTVTQ